MELCLIAAVRLSKVAYFEHYPLLFGLGDTYVCLTHTYS